MNKILLFLFLILIQSPSFADMRNEQRTWLGLFAQKKITSNLNLWAETQLRHDETHQTMNQVLNRFGLIKPISENHEIGFLFAYVQSDSAKEYRPTFQYSYKVQRESNFFTLRNRLELRDVEQQDAKSVRWRSLARWSHALNASYDFLIWDEPFLNLSHEKWTGERLFERNRLFIGTKIKWSELAFELGYLNQFIPRATKSIQEHTLVTYLFF